LSGVSIWRGGKGFGIMAEKIHAKYGAYKVQLPGVYGRLVEKPLQGAFGYSNTLHKPFVGVSLAAEFGTYKIAYMYLHKGCVFQRWRLTESAGTKQIPRYGQKGSVNFSYEPKVICRNLHHNKFRPRLRERLQNLFNVMLFYWQIF